MSYALTKGNADVLGTFRSADAAKRDVQPPDYQITFIGIQDESFA